MVKVLFDLKKEYYFNALYPLYREMAKDLDYDLWVHAGKDEKRLFGLVSVSQKGRIVSRLQSEGFKITEDVAGFDVVVCGDALRRPDRYGDVLRIHVDHGVGIKTLRIRNIVKQKSFRYHVFLEGHYWYDYIKSIGWERRADFYITGIPKLDPFFWDDFYDKKRIIADLNIDEKKKTVLFAPSYRPSCIAYLKDKIIDLVPTYNVIVKLHPYSWGGKYAPHSQHRLYEKVAKTNRELFLIPNEEYDIYPYLYLADTLISDTSSVINEFLALGKHGIIYELPFDRLMHSDGMPILSIDPKDWLSGAFPHVSDPKDLPSAVESALCPTDLMKEKLKEHRGYFFTGLDGKASWRVKRKIDELVK